MTTPPGLERKAALDQIQKGEKAFARVQQRELDLFQHLVSGKQLVAQASRDIEVLDGLLKTMLTSGYIVAVGVKALGGTIQSNVKGDLNPSKNDPSLSRRSLGSLRIQTKTSETAMVSLVRIGKHRETASYLQNGVSKISLLVTFFNGTSELSHCLLGRKPREAKGLNEDTNYFQDYPWFHLRRIFPIHSTNFRDSKTVKIDNGEYEEGVGSEALSPYVFDEIPSYGTWHSGYVAIVRDEATFVVVHRLPAQFARNLTGVSVRAISSDEAYFDASPKKSYLMCNTPLF
ncbi:MAG: hypothetical protein ABIO96_12090 [Nitrospiraceae bacterium]